MEPRTDPQDVEAEKFTLELADYLRQGRVDNEYNELVVVAPPAFLGRLRNAIDSPTAGTIRAEIAKNYTNEKWQDALERVRELVT